jgi:hypothetical protein
MVANLEQLAFEFANLALNSLPHKAVQKAPQRRHLGLKTVRIDKGVDEHNLLDDQRVCRPIEPGTTRGRHTHCAAADRRQQPKRVVDPWGSTSAQ